MTNFVIFKPCPNFKIYIFISWELNFKIKRFNQNQSRMNASDDHIPTYIFDYKTQVIFFST
jgi:hypothetical protein